LRNTPTGTSSSPSEKRSFRFASSLPKDCIAANLCSAQELEFCEKLQLVPIFYLLVKRLLLEEMKSVVPPDRSTLQRWVKLDGSKCGTVYDFVLGMVESERAKGLDGDL